MTRAEPAAINVDNVFVMLVWLQRVRVQLAFSSGAERVMVVSAGVVEGVRE